MMFEYPSYLGVDEGHRTHDTSFTVNQLVSQMRFHGRTSVSGIHKVPGIIVPTEAGRVLHPVMSKVGSELLGFAYVFPKLVIAAERTPTTQAPAPEDGEAMR